MSDVFSKTIKLYLNHKIIAILFLGIVSGLPLSLVLSTLTVWLAEDGVSKSAIGLFALITTPYVFKFMWSPLIDRLSLPLLSKYLGRRRGWLIFTQLFLAISIIALGIGNPAQNPWYMALWAFIVAVMSASQDIVIDAYRVEILEDKEQGAGAAMIVLGYRIGMLISSAGALYIAHYYSWFVAYFVMATLVVGGMIISLLMAEPANQIPDNDNNASGLLTKITSWLTEAVIKPFTDIAKRQGWLIILLFILLYKLGDAFAGIMTNPFLIDLGFDKAQIATIVKIFGVASAVIGSFIGGVIVNRFDILKSLLICGILQMLSNLMFVLQAKIGYNTELLALVIAIENLSAGMGTTAFVAYISSLCNKQYTATQYALFSALASFGRSVFSASSGWFVERLGWEYFFILSTIIAIPALIMLIIMKKLLPTKE